MPDFGVNLGFRERKVPETYIFIFIPIFLVQNTRNLYF